MNLQRYSRQTVISGFGTEGQKKLNNSRAVIIGIGATGTVIANNLCRAGVGFLRLVDRDYAELSNLQRQTLFTEEDAKKQTPKAVAAFEHLKMVNSEIEMEPVVVDVNSGNIEALISDVDIVLDGSDNLDLRYLINEACVKHNKPWIYSGALTGNGMTMNIIPGRTPCLHCFMPQAPESVDRPTCSTAGVLNGITGIVASIASTEAIKILIGSENIRKSLITFDIWENWFQEIEVNKNKACTVCVKHEYELLGHLSGSSTTNLCGRDSIQVMPGKTVSVDFEGLAQRLKKAGAVRYNKFMLHFSDEKTEFNLFSDGRAIINNVKDENAAKSVYSEYIGL